MLINDKIRDQRQKEIIEDILMGDDPEMADTIAKNIGIYEKQKESLIKGYFLVGVVGSDGNQVKQKVVIYNIMVEQEENKQIGLRGFYFILFDDFENMHREGLVRLTYLSIIIIILPGIWEDNPKQINNFIDK